ncbi:hypothetical protein D6851_15645 [Altericroceibacterium spongiae]|uniref:Uncharacterized protein n=1 Tax=Altericroceibacterium spongiae TaxID=2320269 RepID=A0A420EAL6_9SPHN|nr:hypothetical protein [Altericroceibacterium spongiae]RKF17693.1 hypothetical protein D6851_15645 [Altericroceibacterium spongiae]
MPQETIMAWTALYIAVGLLALLCSVLALTITIYDLHVGNFAPDISSWTGLALLIPRLWLRWQINYFKGAPVIIAIAVYFAADIGFDKLWPS